MKSPYVWLFAIAYFFVYVVRQGVTSWFIFYLQARICVFRAQRLPAQIVSFSLQIKAQFP